MKGSRLDLVFGHHPHNLSLISPIRRRSDEGCSSSRPLPRVLSRCPLSASLLVVVDFPPRTPHRPSGRRTVGFPVLRQLRVEDQWRRTVVETTHYFPWQDKLGTGSEFHPLRIRVAVTSRVTSVYSTEQVPRDPDRSPPRDTNTPRVLEEHPTHKMEDTAN